jgi:hypothetical protein
MNRRLFKACLFKEQFERAWTYRTEQGMRGFLDEASPGCAKSDLSLALLGVESLQIRVVSSR